MPTNLSGSPQKSKSKERNNAPPHGLVPPSAEVAINTPGFAAAYPTLYFSLQSPGKPKLFNELARRAASAGVSLDILLTNFRPEGRDARPELAGAYLDLCELGQLLKSLDVSTVEPLPYTRRESFGEAMNNLVFCFKSDYPNLNMVLHFPKANAGLENLIEQSEAFEDMLKYFQVATAPEELNTNLYLQNRKLNKELRLLLILLRNLRGQRRMEELTKKIGNRKRASNEEE